MTVMELNRAFDALQEMVQSLPEPAKKRRNMLEIAGYPSRENVNSNLLAFYFDENEEHNFGRLFFDSLLQILRNRGVQIADAFSESAYIVHREWSYIDILIEAENKEWAIIIENKIHHHLHNDLKKYWSSVDIGKKMGIVLSLNTPNKEDLEKHKEDGILYHSILHSDLVTEVKKQLPEVYEQSDDRHLLYLKDYIDNINQHYNNTTFAPEMEDTLSLYHDRFELLDSLKKTEGELRDYVSDSFFRAMMEFGFDPYTSSLNVKSKHLYPNKSFDGYREGYVGYRFYVYLDHLLRYNKLELYFELHRDHTKYGDVIKEKVWKDKDYGPIVSSKSGGGVNYDHYHIACIDGHDMSKEKGDTLYDKIKNFLQNNLFNSGGVVEAAAAALESELNK